MSYQHQSWRYQPNISPLHTEAHGVSTEVVEFLLDSSPAAPVPNGIPLLPLPPLPPSPPPPPPPPPVVVPANVSESENQNIGNLQVFYHSSHLLQQCVSIDRSTTRTMAIEKATSNSLFEENLTTRDMQHRSSRKSKTSSLPTAAITTHASSISENATAISPSEPMRRRSLRLQLKQNY